ncbi:MAG: DUF4271 domain-containing protein [Bacteroidota bacterium]
MIFTSCSDIQQDDTTCVCARNSIADITFYDSNNVITKIESFSANKFPILFTEKTRQMQFKARTSLIKHLKPGQDLPSQPLHNDWMIGIILVCAFLFSLIRTTSKSILPGVVSFFLFRGIKDSSSREIDGLFHGQPKILSLISFFIIGLFAYCAASYFNVIPAGSRGIYFWLICLCIIFPAVILRYLVCTITGYLSGEKAVFREYLLCVSQFYRLSALFLFMLIILMSYTMLLPAKESIIIGMVALGIMYLFRVLRLMIIFLNRNISIFYLILYLCALEFLPVLISVKYFTGLV